MQDNPQAVLILATTLKLKGGVPSLSTNTVDLANDGHGERRGSREATGPTVAESEENFTRTESVARWLREGRAAYETEREALLFLLLLLLLLF